MTEGKEGYQPSEEEIKKAERMMTDRDAGLSEKMEQGLRFRDEIHEVMRSYEVAFGENRVATDAIRSFNELGWEYLPSTTKGEKLRSNILHNLRNNGAMFSKLHKVRENLKGADDVPEGFFCPIGRYPVK